MWRVEFTNSNELFGHAACVMNFETYCEACNCARDYVCADMRHALVMKVGGTPLQHHIDGTKTTIYTYDTFVGEPKRWYW